MFRIQVRKGFREETLVVGLKDRQEFARWTVETFQEEDPTMCKSRHERLVLLRSIKSLTIGCASAKSRRNRQGEIHRSLYVLPRILELILGGNGSLGKSRQKTGMLLFAFFVNHFGSHLRRRSSSDGPRATVSSLPVSV